MLWFISAALATSPEPPSADILTVATVSAAPDGMVAVLTDLDRLARTVPKGCMSRFTAGSPKQGKGATGKVRYDMAAMHRSLTFTITRVDVGEHYVVDFDHASNRGFVTRWTLRREGDATSVKVQTPLNTPPWPFTQYYFQAVQPEWQACQERWVSAVAAAAGPSGSAVEYSLPTPPP